MHQNRRKFEDLSLGDIKQSLARSVKIAEHQLKRDDLTDAERRAWLNSQVQAGLAYSHVYKMEWDLLRSIGTSSPSHPRKAS